MTNKTRILAKGMLPALLLSAALSVPAPASAGNAKNERAHAAEKAKEHQKQAKQNAKAARQNAQQAQKHAQKAQQQAQKARRQQPAKVVVVAPQRRVVAPRQVVVVPVQPVVVAQRNGRNTRNRWDNWNRGYSKYSTGVFQLDATSSGRSSGCALVSDHRGQVIPLVGIDPFAFRQGDHVLISGRIQNGTACGTAFRVSSVDRVYDGSNHRNVLFDSRRDGDFFSYRDRGRDDRYDRDNRDDRYGRDDRYDDRNDNRRAISIDGRLDDSGDCPVIRGDRGEYYDLIGDLRNFRDGARVRVIGRDGFRSDCGGQAIEVGEIIRR
ncbi:MAG TPA: hypothetical protein VKK31_11135 [Thermoanaerobaculia bacterium]|nr:hypothetical protein [Thermoanaerobaculia bacterium]